jgi:hypothetical protein
MGGGSAGQDRIPKAFVSKNPWCMAGIAFVILNSSFVIPSDF